LLSDGTCVQIATGAMVPEGTSSVIRVEESTVEGEVVLDGTPRKQPDWRMTGEEAKQGEELRPAGTAITPGVIGLAAACGYDTLPCRPAPRAALLVFGDELLTSGPPAAGQVRDCLGPSLPSWLRRVGTDVVHVRAPVGDTLEDHVHAIRDAVEAGAQVVCTTGGTMHGPVDHLHAALAELGAEYVVNTVAVRPGFPMLIARLPGGQFIAGLTGRPLPALPPVTLGADVAGRGDFTHLALVRRDPVDGRVYPVPHVASSMLRGLARSIGFAVVPPGAQGVAGQSIPLVPLPLFDTELSE
jgi:molybdopterin molybdotransferase